MMFATKTMYVERYSSARLQVIMSVNSEKYEMPMVLMFSPVDSTREIAP